MKFQKYPRTGITPALPTYRSSRTIKIQIWMANVIAPLRSGICSFFSICFSLKYESHTTTSFKQREKMWYAKALGSLKNIQKLAFTCQNQRTSILGQQNEDQHTKKMTKENEKWKEKGTPHRYLLRPYPPSIVESPKLI